MVPGLGKFPPDTSEDSLKCSNSQNMKRKKNFWKKFKATTKFQFLKYKENIFWENTINFFRKIFFLSSESSISQNIGKTFFEKIRNFSEYFFRFLLNFFELWLESGPDTLIFTTNAYILLIISQIICLISVNNNVKA